MTVHTVNQPGGWCTICGENEDYLLAQGNGDVIEYEEFVLAPPEVIA